MKILHVISSLETGGAQRLVADLLPVLQKNPEDDIRLVVFQKSGSSIEKNLEESGVEIFSLDTGIRDLRVVTRLRKHLRWANIAHIHLFPTDYLVRLANVNIKTPLIFTEHSTHNRRRDIKWLNPLERMMYKGYEKVICISEGTKSTLKDWIGDKLSEKRLVVIENGVNLQEFRNTKCNDPKNIFGRSGYPILMISRFSEAKDHASVIRAIAEIKHENVFVVFVGDGALKGKMELLARELKVDDRVVFMGTRGDVPDIIASSYLGVQSSHWEGFGLTAIEMMAGGLPVIVSDVEGLSEVVGEAALKFEKGNANELSRQINRLLDDSELYRKYKEKGLEQAGRYSIESMAKAYRDLYSEVLNKKF